MVADALGKPRERLSFLRQTILPESNDRSVQPTKKISRTSPLRKCLPAKELPNQAPWLETPNAKVTPAEMAGITPETAATEQTAFSSAVKSRLPDSMVCGEFESPESLLKVKQIRSERADGAKTHSLHFSAHDESSKGALRKTEPEVDAELQKLLENSTAGKITDGDKIGERFIPLRMDFERYMVKNEIEGRAPDGLAEDGRLEAGNPSTNNQQNDSSPSYSDHNSGENLKKYNILL